MTSESLCVCVCARVRVCVHQVPVLSFASIIAQKASRARSVKAFESARELAATASEVLANARTVQSFTAEEKEAARYAAHREGKAHTQARIGRRNTGSSAVSMQDDVWR